MIERVKTLLATSVTSFVTATGTHGLTQKKGLGRGLDALLAGKFRRSRQRRRTLRTLAVEMLQPGKYQPRTRMDQVRWRSWPPRSSSQGVMQPILVREIGRGGRYEIIAGERRWRAAQLAGLTKCRCWCARSPDEAALAMSA
jgi:ParB family chromosome partitioning protein